MKTSFKISLLLSATAALTMAACGKFEKNPVPDLDTYRAQGTAHKDDVSAALPTRTVYAQVPAQKEVEVDKEVTALDSTFVSITTTDSVMFPEGESTTITLKVSLDSPDLVGYVFDLTSSNMPPGNSTLVSTGDVSNPRLQTFKFTWTPENFGLKGNQPKIFSLNLIASLKQAPADAKAETVARLKQSPKLMTLSLVVHKPNDKAAKAKSSTDSNSTPIVGTQSTTTSLTKSGSPAI